MGMLGYFDVFPAKTRTELRTAAFEDGGADDRLPSGTFVFTEYFCTDPRCDCQRVLVKVFRSESQDVRPEEVATISYSWNPNSDSLWKKLNSEMPNPFLDPLHRQAPYASGLLEFWAMMIERDKEYASRLQRHYDEIRTEVGQPAENLDRPHSTHQATRGSSRRPFANRKVRKKRVARSRKRR